MSRDADVTCGQCGAMLDVDPANNAAPNRSPCPNCGSTSRGVVIHPGTIQGHITLNGNLSGAKVSGAHGEIRFGATASGAVAHDTGSGFRSDDAASAPKGRTLTVLGQEVVHRCELVICRPNDEGIAVFADDQGDLIASGYGDNVDDALPDLMLSMLPPDHPDFDAGPSEP